MLNHVQIECPGEIAIHLDEIRLCVDVDWRGDNGHHVGSNTVSFMPFSAPKGKFRDMVLSAFARILTENGYTVTSPNPPTPKITCRECGGCAARIVGKASNLRYGAHG